jgi:hypothetical protein
MPKSISDYDIDEEAFSLRDAMDFILAGLEALYLSSGVPLPTRRYWIVGDAAQDCEQVTVSFLQMYLGIPGDDASVPQKCNAPLSIVVNISISREVKGMDQRGNAPAPEVLQGDAEWAALDAWVIMTGLKDLAPSSIIDPNPAVIATATAPETQGNIMTTQVQLTVQVL